MGGWLGDPWADRSRSFTLYLLKRPLPTHSLEWTKKKSLSHTVFIMSLCGSATFFFFTKKWFFFFPTLTDLAAINTETGQPANFKIDHYYWLAAHRKVRTSTLITWVTKRRKSAIIITYFCCHRGKGLLNEGDYCDRAQFNLGDGSLMQQKLCPPERPGPILAMAGLNI